MEELDRNINLKTLLGKSLTSREVLHKERVEFLKSTLVGIKKYIQLPPLTNNIFYGKSKKELLYRYNETLNFFVADYDLVVYVLKTKYKIKKGTVLVQYIEYYIIDKLNIKTKRLSILMLKENGHKTKLKLLK